MTIPTSVITPNSPSPPIKCRGQIIIFSPPKVVDINKLILKPQSSVAPTTSPVSRIKMSPQKQTAQEYSSSRNTTTFTKKQASTIITMGPHPYQQLELSSSDDSSNTWTASTGSRNQTKSISRSKSASPRPTYRGTIPPSSVSLRAFTPSPPLSEPIDWVAFSDPQKAYEEYGSIGEDYDGSWSGESWSDDASLSPAIITPENSQAAPRVSFSLQDLTIILNQPSYILPPTPPSTPLADRRRRASESPSLSMIPSVSTPSTPFNANVSLPQSPSSLSSPGRLFDLASTQLDFEITFERDDDNVMSEEDHIVFTKEAKKSHHVQCDACGKAVELKKANKMIPCGHITCSACFSSTLSAVSPARTYSQCVACATNLLTFERIKDVPTDVQDKNGMDGKRFHKYHIPVVEQSHESVVMRIDNIAWDMTPDVVEAFLPPDTLAENVPQAIHIPLNRFDGRTKDFLYIEAASSEAAKQILQTRQNSYMPGGRSTGGKKRPVTITIVSHSELISELRPHSSQELHALLQLCHMALGPPTTASRFVKSRHGPFYALMSIMSKLTGKGSPAYWDLFHIASGAISALAQAMNRSTYHQSSLQYDDHTPGPAAEEDNLVFSRLLNLFEKCFGMAPALG